MNNIENFGSLFKKYRKQKNVYLKKIAKDTNISISHLSNIENNTKIPNTTHFIKLCEALQVTYDELKELIIEYSKLIKPQQLSVLINSCFPESNYIISLIVKDTFFEKEFNKLYKQVNDDVKPVINKAFITKTVGNIEKALNKNRTNAVDCFDMFDIIKKKADILFKIDIKKLDDEYIEKINILKKTCQYYKTLLKSENNKTSLIARFYDEFEKNIPGFDKLTDSQKTILNELLKSEWFNDEKHKCLLDSEFYLNNITFIHNFIFGSFDTNQGYIIETKDNNYFIFKIIPTFDKFSILDLISDDYNSLIDIKINQLKEIILSVKNSLNIQDKNNDDLILPHINSLISIFSLIKDFCTKDSVNNMQKNIITFSHKEIQQENRQLKQEISNLKQQLDDMKKEKE